MAEPLRKTSSSPHVYPLDLTILKEAVVKAESEAQARVLFSHPGFLLDCRTRANLSQAQLASLAGCMPAYISHIERGIRAPAGPLALRIWEVFFGGGEHDISSK